MAERRMFAKSIIDSDAFLEMPLSSQALYFHLSMRADDDGFVNNPKKIQKIVGANDNDLTILKAKSYILTFEDGVIVIKHWRINNYIRSDRYKPTLYQEEKDTLKIKDNGAYTFGIPTDNQLDTQYSIGKISIDKNSIGSSSIEVDTIYDYYQSEIGQLTPRQYEIFNSYNNDIPEELIKIAIDKTVDSGAKNFRYMEAILKEWKSKGYKTLGDVENEIKTKEDDYWND